MNEFRQYIMNLPKASTEDEIERWKEWGLPFISGEGIENIVHCECQTAVPTQITKVYVPEYQFSVPIFKYHYKSRRPRQECHKNLVQYLLGQGMSQADAEHYAMHNRKTVKLDIDFHPRVTLQLVALEYLRRLKNYMDRHPEESLFPDKK